MPAALSRLIHTWPRTQRARQPLLRAQGRDSADTASADQAVRVQTLVKAGFTQEEAERTVCLQSVQAETIASRLDGRFDKVAIRVSRLTGLLVTMLLIRTVAAL